MPSCRVLIFTEYLILCRKIHSTVIKMWRSNRNKRVVVLCIAWVICVADWLHADKYLLLYQSATASASFVQVQQTNCYQIVLVQCQAQSGSQSVRVTVLPASLSMLILPWLYTALYCPVQCTEYLVIRVSHCHSQCFIQQPNNKMWFDFILGLICTLQSVEGVND